MAQQKPLKIRFGSVLGSIWEGSGEVLGGTWGLLGRFWSFFLMLVFGVVFKHALGGILAGLWLDFKGLGKGFGMVLGGIFKHSGGFWAIVAFSGLLGCF